MLLVKQPPQQDYIMFNHRPEAKGMELQEPRQWPELLRAGSGEPKCRSKGWGWVT